MDIKVKGITFEIMEQALEKARIARLQILDHMSSTISEVSKEVSKYAPKKSLQLMSLKKKLVLL